MTIDDNKSRAMTVSKIFNYIGGTFIFFGITYLLFNNWFVLASFARIVVTLGIAGAALTTAVSLSKNGNTSSSAVFYVLGGLLLPLGLSVTLNAFGLDNNLDLENIVISGLSFSVFLLLQLQFSRKILLLFCIIFGSYLIVGLTNYLAHNVFAITNLWDYQLIALGASYLLMGYTLSSDDNGLTGPLYFFGDLMVLCGSFHLAGLFENRANAILFWEFLAPLLVLLSFMLAIPLKSKSMLYLGAIFLMIYIPSLTSKFAYLFGNLGWPVILIGAGIGLMMLGYLIVQMEKRFPK